MKRHFFALACFAILASCDPPPSPEKETSSNAASGMESHRPKDQKLARQRLDLFETLRAIPYRIKNEKVLQSMGAVPREEFVDKKYQDRAYLNRPLPIGWDQTISQPFIVAFMTEKLEPDPADRVLEIGTGCGYQAAVLSQLVDHVYSIEIVEPLAEAAKKRLQRLGYKNITTKTGDGYRGWKEHAPFDAIIVTCAPDSIPQPLVEQLREGGRMIIPVGEKGDQKLFLLEKVDGEIKKKNVLSVAFVPMTGEAEEL